MVDRVSPARSVASQVRSFAVVILAAAALVFADSSLISAAEITVSPTTIVIDRPESTQQVLVSTIEGAGRVDVTRKVVYQVIDPQVARAGSDGLVHPLRDGKTELIIRHGDVERRVPLEVTGFSAPPPVSFAHEVQPILTKGRCNSGGCHGKAEGQNGFKLSLFGFDATADYDAIVRAARGRRVMLASPERSLLLTKGSAQMPHGGGLKLDPDGPGYRRVLRWLAAGAPATVTDERPIERIEVEPAVVDLTAGGQQQLRVTAIDSAGTKRCATVEADFVSNAPHIALPDERGLVRTTDAPGEAAILVRYQGHVAVARVVVPRPGVAVPRVAENNFIDRHIWDKLTQLGLPASDVAEDGMFLRRVYLDVIGTLPTAAEAREFLDDPSPDKRSRVINQLLKRPEYADYWAMKWANLLRADKIKITPQATVGMTRWLRKQFASNRPYDEMVREILTAQGPIQSESPAAFFKSLDQPELAGRSISQLFLGVRIECAQCHHHPSERWSQDDYAGWAGFFTGIATKRLPEGADAIVAKGGTDAKHPRSGVVVPARVLGGEPADFSQVRDRRQVMADWVVHPDNPFFARAIANRLWAHYFGRGLVEPIDDQRATNPPVNEPLLAALAAHLKDVKYDLHAFTRTLLESRAYQLSSQATDANRDDRQNFSHAQPKALPAEVLLDAVCQTTGVPEKFNGWPLGVRSIEVWDNRMPSYFFRIFGRPARATVCECERSNEPSISQALHLLNSPEINSKLGNRAGAARRLADSPLSPDQLIDELYLGTLARRPTSEERAVLQAAFRESTDDRRGAVEDVLWTLLNSKEFLYNH